MKKVIKYMLFYIDKVISCFVKKEKQNSSSDKKQVAILVSFGIGDGLMFLGTAKRYRELYPKEEYEITAICSGKVKMLFEKETDFDNVIQIDVDKAASNITKRIQLIKDINKKYYDIFIDVLGPLHFNMNVYIVRVPYDQLFLRVIVILKLYYIIYMIIYIIFSFLS